MFLYTLLALQKSVIYQNNYWSDVNDINEYFSVKIDLLRDNLLKIKVLIILTISIGFIKFA